MSLRYCHTLIPTSSQFIPAASQVQAFLSAMIARGVLGGTPTLELRTPSSRTRTGRNPFSGKIEVHQMNDFTEIADLDRIPEAIENVSNYAIEASAMGEPKKPPIPIEFEGPYHVGVKCRLSSKLCSMSDLHEESGGTEERPFFGKPCDGTPGRALFSNPHTLEIIEVPGAACARFWIEFELGKSLFPSFDRGDLEFLDPAIVAIAERLFQARFAQGCYWG